MAIDADVADLAGILKRKREGHRQIVDTPSLQTAIDVLGGVENAIPINVIIPSISGTPQVGQTLTANPGQWTNNPTSYAYQWYTIVG